MVTQLIHRSNLQPCLAAPVYSAERAECIICAKVPYELRAVIGKTEIRKSLRTSTLKEALPKLKVESLKVDREFSVAEEKKTGRKAVGPELSQELVAWLTSKYFVQLEQERSLHEAQSEDWTEQERREVGEASVPATPEMDVTPTPPPPSEPTPPPEPPQPEPTPKRKPNDPKKPLDDVLDIKDNGQKKLDGLINLTP